MDNWNTADWIGFYGAITATVSILWQIIWTILRNRSRLKIRAMYGIRAEGPGIRSEDGKIFIALLASATLVGDKPITIRKFGIELVKDKAIIYPSVNEVPVELKPGNRGVFLEIPLDEVSFNPENGKWVAFTDDTDKTWRKRIRPKDYLETAEELHKIFDKAGSDQEKNKNKTN